MDLAEIPIGFSMALAQNEEATNAYAVMTKEQKRTVLSRAHKARTEAQMQQLITELAKQN